MSTSLTYVIPLIWYKSPLRFPTPEIDITCDR